MKSENQIPKFYQYYKDQDIPVYLKVENTFLGVSFFNLLKSLHFGELTLEEYEKKKNQNKLSRTLIIEEASHRASQQINRTLVDDRYGPESVTTMSTHKVYRYKNQAVIIYSFLVREWHMGCYAEFASEQNIFEAKMVINRYLSWSLSMMGIAGFWGTPIGEGAVITRPIDSKGEALFFDLKNMQMFTIDGIKKIKPGFRIIRLDSTLVDRNVIMRREELVGFLSSHTVYIDPSGSSVPIRQVVQELSALAQGILHPTKSFKPRFNTAA
ncbi:MAG: hypothetical protein ACOYL6_09455 [Bacteriovoracaceae bacterium]